MSDKNKDYDPEAVNHFLIGLGGTGGKVLREFRRKMYEQLRTPSPDRFEYLYLDSSAGDLEMKGPQWHVPGGSLKLDQNNVLAVNKGGDIPYILDNPSKYPHIEPWIGSREQLSEVLGNIGGVNVFGGQRRRLGRFLFAYSAEEFLQRVTTLTRAMEGASQGVASKGVHFHVCCGLAGGTGSGSVVDVVAQLRNAFDDAEHYRIVIYALLPETGDTPWATSEGYYHENGYGALRELNGLASDNGWRPHDVTPDGAGKRVEINTPFTTCYVFTNTNKDKASRPVEDMPKLLARFLYQKVRVIGKSNAASKLKDNEDLENHGGIVADKKESPGGEDRSRRFASFGIKQVVYPEQEVREYLNFGLMERAAVGLRFKNWTDEDGYVAQERAEDWHEFVRKPDKLRGWKLSPEHLQLQMQILETDRGRESFEAIWSRHGEEINDAHQQAISEASDRKSFDSFLYFNRAFGLVFQKHYQELGVPGFYEQKRAQVQEYADAILSNLDGWAREQLRDGAWSVADLLSWSKAMRSALEERKRGIDDQIKRLQSEELKHLEQELGEISDDLNALPDMDSLLWKARAKRNQAVMNDIVERLVRNYVQRFALATKQKHALPFEEALLERILSKLDDQLIDPLRKLDSACNTVAQQAKARREELEPKSETDPAAFAKPLIKFLDAESIIAHRRAQESDRDLQEGLLKESRDRLFDGVLGAKGSSLRDGAASVAQSMELGLEAIADQKTNETQNELPQDKRLLGVSILALLARQYQTKEAIEDLARNLLHHSGIFARIDNRQWQLKQYGEPGDLEKFVLLPKDSASDDFSEKLVEALRTTGGLTDSKDFPSVKYELKRDDGTAIANELTVLATAHYMPLRQFEATEWLKKRYERRVTKEGDFVPYVVHSEGNGSHVPELYPLTEKELEEQIRPHILLGMALGRIEQAETEDGPAFEIDVVDAKGLRRTARVPGLLHEFARVDEDVAFKIISEVRHELSAADREKRKKIHQWLIDQQDGLAKEAGQAYERLVLPALETAIDQVGTA